MDRTAKLHQHEFEVLPAIWDKLSIAISEVQTFTSRHQSYADVDAMHLDQFNEFVENSGFADWQKKELKFLDKGQRQQKYQKFDFWRKHHSARVAYADLHNYLASKGIFVPVELSLGEAMKSKWS
jgi:hypothetical protein